jgi:hypothetical protein
MTTLLAIDDDLIESASAFADAWNSDPSCVEVATVAVVPRKPDLIIEVVGAFLVTISTGLLTHAIYDLLVGKFRKLGSDVVFEEIEMPDGTKISKITRRKST